MADDSKPLNGIATWIGGLTAVVLAVVGLKAAVQQLIPAKPAQEGKPISDPKPVPHDNTPVHDRTSADYIIPDSDSRRLVAADLAGMSSARLGYARNEIYARHGFHFRTADMQAYFAKKSWYAPSNEPVILTPTSNITSCSSAALRKEQVAEETLVVLGAAVWAGGVPSPTLRRRTEYACALFKAGHSDLIVLSGGVGKHPPAEANAMAAIAVAMDISPAALLLDRNALTTLDTAAFAAAMPRAADRHFVAVTDLYHAPRTWLAFRSYGLTISVSSPPVGGGTHRTKLLFSFAREIPALGLYAAHFIRLRLSRA